jgi:antitoxin component YwqK of YwqJK toxin-antitoxin module
LNGAKHGVWKSFHPSGTLAASIKYRNGKAYGYSFAYDEEGQEIYRTYWLNGDKLTKEELAKYLEKCRKQGVIPEE